MKKLGPKKLYLGICLPDHCLGQNVINNFVGNGFTGCHQLVKLSSALCSGHHFGSQQIAGGDVGEGVLHGDALALGAFARSRPT